MSLFYRQFRLLKKHAHLSGLIIVLLVVASLMTGCDNSAVISSQPYSGSPAAGATPSAVTPPASAWSPEASYSPSPVLPSQPTPVSSASTSTSAVIDPVTVESLEDIYFPVGIDLSLTPIVDGFNMGYTTGLADGLLVLEEGYLRVINEQRKIDDIIIWPHDYALGLEDGRVEIRDSEGRLRARNGDKIRIGGSGVYDREMAERHIGHPLPEDAAGPYFVTPSVEAYLYFPVQLEENSLEPETLTSITGDIRLENGCLRLKRDVGDSPLWIWPYGYSLELAYGTFCLIDEKGQPVLVLYNWQKTVHGTEVDKASALELAGPTLPEDAPGPFWQVVSVAKYSP
ncbi:MAG: hypothetical protein JXA46_12085 [Dehalococcoidales bacterium]|nr:hypothetical protein [Dehalococcoidales bacterium]